VLAEDTADDERVVAGDARVRLGEGVSGWVAANRRAMVNADARLELQERASQRMPALRSCLGVPCMRDGDTLAGVIVVFATSTDAFTESHRRLLEAVASRVAPLLPVSAPFIAAHGVPARNTSAQNRTS
jgi:GAF domain-containing protein